MPEVLTVRDTPMSSDQKVPDILAGMEPSPDFFVKLAIAKCSIGSLGSSVIDDTIRKSSASLMGQGSRIYEHPFFK